jgi:hypothetical protein
MLQKRLCWALAVGLVVSALPAAAGELKETVVEKYGYKFKIPEEFKVQDKIDKTTSWIYQPGMDAPGDSGKKKGGGLLGKAVSKATGIDPTAAAPAGDASGPESALTIYVNWTWMPDVDPGTLYKANIDQVKQNAASPDPDYTAITVLDKKQGYAMEGNAFWYKEVDKDDPGEIHRWHIYVAGNKSAYTVGLCGTYAQFEKWGPVYEKVIKSFELVPLKE